MQNVAAVSSRSRIVRGGPVKLVHPGFARQPCFPCPAEFFELVGQLPAWIRVNAFRRGESDLDQGVAAVATEMSPPPIADVDGIL